MLAEVIQSAAFLVVAIAILIAVVRGVRRLSIAIGRVHLVAEEVNRAVNNVSPGTPRLVERVADIGDKLDQHIRETHGRFDRLEDFVTQPRKGL